MQSMSHNLKNMLLIEKASKKDLANTLYTYSCVVSDNELNSALIHTALFSLMLQDGLHKELRNP